MEEKLLAIFRDILNNDEFGVTDSFFDYGGYSLLTVNLFTRINRALTSAFLSACSLTHLQFERSLKSSIVTSRSL